MEVRSNDETALPGLLGAELNGGSRSGDGPVDPATSDTGVDC